MLRFFGSKKIKSAGAYETYSALVDANNTLLALSPHFSAIQFLQEATPNAVHVPGANFPHYTASFPLATARPETYPEWTWGWKTRLFSETKLELVTPEVRSRSRLTMAKLPLIRKMLFNINAIRHPVRTGVDFQETVYLVKRMQAQAFRDAGYPEDIFIDYPYVLQYADYAHISMKQAADDILFKAKLDDEILAQSELLRLKYFHKLKSASTLEELPLILSEFMKDCYHS